MKLVIKGGLFVKRTISIILILTLMLASMAACDFGKKIKFTIEDQKFVLGKVTLRELKERGFEIKDYDYYEKIMVEPNTGEKLPILDQKVWLEEKWIGFSGVYNDTEKAEKMTEVPLAGCWYISGETPQMSLLGLDDAATCEDIVDLLGEPIEKEVDVFDREEILYYQTEDEKGVIYLISFYVNMDVDELFAFEVYRKDYPGALAGMTYHPALKK